jgi:hypothetical protein
MERRAKRGRKGWGVASSSSEEEDERREVEGGEVEKKLWRRGG